MVGYIFASFLTIYAPTLKYKSIGYFFQGLFHVKITLSYAYLFELIDEDSKSLCATTLNTFDAITLGVVGLVMTFWSRDMVALVKVANLIETSGIILFIVIFPESPKWLFL